MFAPASYTDIFNRREHLYHRAIAAYPDAKAEEFIALQACPEFIEGRSGSDV